jgi:hypothetical protein
MTALTDRCSLRRVLTTCSFAAVALFAAGCGDDDKDAGSGDAAKPASFAISATAEGKKKKALEFPSTVKAGLVTITLTNNDTVARSAQIIRVTGDQTIDDVLKVVNAEETKIPSFMQDGGGLGSVKPGASASATQNLAPGRYVIWDDEGGDEGDAPGNDELGAKGEFTVTGEASDAELPAQPATVTAHDEEQGGKETYSFELKGLKAGTNAVRFENTGEQLHHALFFPVAKGKTFEDAKQAFTSDEEPTGPPPVDFANAVGTTVIDGGIAQNISLDLKAGTYAVICFLSDRDGGKPHVAKGMIKELTVE